MRHFEIYRPQLRVFCFYYRVRSSSNYHQSVIRTENWLVWIIGVLFPLFTSPSTTTHIVMTSHLQATPFVVTSLASNDDVIAMSTCIGERLQAKFSVQPSPMNDVSVILANINGKLKAKQVRLQLSRDSYFVHWIWWLISKISHIIFTFVHSFIVY